MRRAVTAAAAVLALCLVGDLRAESGAPQAASPSAVARPASSTAAAKAPATAVKVAPAPAATPANKPEECLLFTVRIGQRQVLGRMDPEGKCKAYLGEQGKGWIGYADPKAQGDDYQAVSDPEGKRLALISSRGGAINLWLLSADATKWQQLTDDDGGILPVEDATGPVLAFSPDGKQLAVVRRGALWVLNLSGPKGATAASAASAVEPVEQLRTLTKERGVRSLAWSPDSRWLAYLVGSSLRKVDTAGNLDVLVNSGLADQPQIAWLPDAKAESIYFLSAGLRKVDSRRRVTLMAPSSVKPNDIAIFPGGRQVALLATAASGSVEVFLAAVGDKSATTTQVTSNGAEGVLASSLPKTLYFLRDGAIWRCEQDGAKARPLNTVRSAAARVGMLPPLKGICP